jgi:SAM-dependent methyltransferase
MSPLSDAALDEAIAQLALPPNARVLEVGCGRAEVLRRIVERWDARATGYDRDPAAIAEARRRVPEADLLVAEEPPPGPFDLVVCVASSHALGGFPGALGALRGLVAGGGRVVLGEGYWQREPSPAYLDALGGASADELGSYTELLEAARRAGLTRLWASVASAEDWERYERTLVGNAERWAAAHAGEPGAEVLRERAARARARLSLPDGHATLGFALLLLRAEPNRL